MKNSQFYVNNSSYGRAFLPALPIGKQTWKQICALLLNLAMSILDLGSVMMWTTSNSGLIYHNMIFIMMLANIFPGPHLLLCQSKSMPFHQHRICFRRAQKLSYVSLQGVPETIQKQLLLLQEVTWLGTSQHFAASPNIQ